MKRVAAVIVFVVMFTLLLPTPGLPSDDTKVKEGMSQVERGAKKLPSEIGAGVKETATGVGTTVVEGAKYSGDKLTDAGQAAAAPAKGVWGHARDGAIGVGRGVRDFFTSLFSN
jgi:hypothetical protein